MSITVELKDADTAKAVMEFLGHELAAQYELETDGVNVDQQRAWLESAVSAIDKAVTDRRMQETINLRITESAVHRLARWASVGRSIDQAIRWLDFLYDNTDDTQALEALPYAIKELRDLKPALDECNRAAKDWLYTDEGKAWFEAAGKPHLGATVR